MLEKIVAEMPKAHYAVAAFHLPVPFSDVEMKRWNVATKAQRQLLAEEGWRKVPSEEELKGQLTNSSQFLDTWTVAVLAEELHRWLLEEK